jgi:hypothetical protein
MTTAEFARGPRPPRRRGEEVGLDREELLALIQVMRSS